MIVATILALLAGATRTAGRMTNARLAQRIGVWQSTFYNYVLGAACSVAALLVSGEAARASNLANGHVPAWAYSGGLVGVAFVVLASLVAPHISAFLMTLLIFVGQIGMGLALDVALGQPLSVGKIIGGLLILAGLLRIHTTERTRQLAEAT